MAPLTVSVTLEPRQGGVLPEILNKGAGVTDKQLDDILTHPLALMPITLAQKEASGLFTNMVGPMEPLDQV